MLESSQRCIGTYPLVHKYKNRTYASTRLWVASASIQTIFTRLLFPTPCAAVQPVSIPQSETGPSGDLQSRRVVGLNEDIILCTIRKSRLLVVSGTPPLSILLYAAEINVVPLALVEHNHALGTLDAFARVVLAEDRGQSWRESTCGGLDVGDFAVEAGHKFVGLAAMIGDPETSADTPIWWAFWHICGDGIGGHPAERSADPQLSMRGRKKENKCALIFSGENHEILERDLADVALVGDGKGVARCIWENNH